MTTYKYWVGQGYAPFKLLRKHRADRVPFVAAVEAKRVTLSKYIDMYIREIETGARQTDRGVNYSPNTVKVVRTALTQWKEFQASKRKKYDFDDIDLKVYYEYTAWLGGDEDA